MSDAETTKAEKTNTSLLIRGALWIAIGALIAAAVVCVFWVLIGDGNGLIGRAFLTIVLLAGFAGIAILEAGLAPNRPDWLSLTSMVTWIVALIVGAVKIWTPENYSYQFNGASPAERFFQLVLVVGLLQLALLHVRLFHKAAQRHVTTFTQVIFMATIAFLVGLVGMLVFWLTFPDAFQYEELYWRIVVALTILVAVGTMLLPLLNALFAPKRHQRTAPSSSPTVPLQAWPTYADGYTPLPMLADSSPDWNAYYTGHPTTLPPQPPVQSYNTSAPNPYAPAVQAPQFPQAPQMPQAPQIPQAPQVPQASQIPQVPQAVLPAPEVAEGSALPVPSEVEPVSASESSQAPDPVQMPPANFPPPPPAAPVPPQ